MSEENTTLQLAIEDQDNYDAYIAAVQKFGLGRQATLRADFHEADFVAGASVIFAMFGQHAMAAVPPHWLINIMRGVPVFVDENGESPGYTPPPSGEDYGELK